jgi:uncharacterized protein YdeI (YjbR/CyaY-like superfamily)
MEVYCSTREEWRKWLDENHLTTSEVWLVYYKKASGKQRIAYRDAVEEALCFGWIDGKIKRVNDDYYVQRFTPRRKGSRWSRHNMEIVKSLLDKGIMKPAGIDAFRAAEDSPHVIYDNRAELNPETPVDLMYALEQNREALVNFMNFSQSARRTYIYWLSTAKRDETRRRRIERIVGYAEKKTLPGLT